MTDERRRGMDEILDAINELKSDLNALNEELGNIKNDVHTVQQRQHEITIPKLQSLDACINGNSHPGMKAEHEMMKEKVRTLDESRLAFRNFMLGSILAVISMIAVAVLSYGRLESQVQAMAKSMPAQVGR